MMPKKLSQIFSRSKSALFLTLLGTITWSLTMVKSGFPRSYGLGFWGPNGHDGVWHIALAESLARGSREMPTFAGASLQNYHIGFDLLLTLLNRITRIPIPVLYFQILPPILALLIGLLSYRFVVSWTKSKKAGLWSLFFIYFGGSFGWLITLLRSGEIGGESMFWSQQSISTLINPPFALSLVFLLLGLNVLIKKNKNFTDYVLCTLYFGLLIQIKAYAAVLVLIGLSVATISTVLHRDVESRKMVSVVGVVFILSFFLSRIVPSDAKNLFEFKPLWFLETMMGYADRLNWPKFYSAMTNYRLGGNWIKGIPAYIIAFLIFWYGNIGTRLVKEILILKWIKNLKNLTCVEIFVASIVIGGGAIPMFFLQKGTPWNTIQFFYYSLFFSGLLAGVGMIELIKKLSGKTSMIRFIEVLVVLFTLPTTIGTLRHYLPPRPPAMLPSGEQEALKFLSKLPDGVILTYPFDREKANAAILNPPRPLYLYESTAYVSAFSQKPTYLEDEINLEITGYSWEERRKKVEDFFAAKDLDAANGFLKENSISYIYLINGQAPSFDRKGSGIAKIFENSAATVFKVEY